jgi:hypothetical protein
MINLVSWRTLTVVSLSAAFGLAVLLPVVVAAQEQRGRPSEVADVAAEKLAEARARAEERKLTAQERVEEIKQQVEERRVTINQEACERRQQQLQAAIPRLSTGAEVVKEKIDNLYARVLGFYESGKLTVTDFDDLNTNISNAKAGAEASLEAVTSFEFELDCDNPNVGEQLDGFRSSIRMTRESLKDYRNELVALISSMRAAAEANSDTNTDTNNQENEGASNEQ